MTVIFPTLPGLAWSVTKSPTFQTRIQRAASGRELRALDYPYPLWQFTLTFEFLRDDPAAGFDELHTLMGFYLMCQGAYGSFLFSDPGDQRTIGEILGIGDSSANVFQLRRTMGISLPGGGFIEPITAPRTIDAVYCNGILQSAASYSVDNQSGLLTFATPPGAGETITADFTYYFRCRFVEDRYDFENFMYRLWQLKKMTFISVRS